HCEEALALAESTGERALLVPFVVTAVRAALAAHRPDEAERWLGRAREHLRGWDAVAGAALVHAEGLLSLATGPLTSAREELEAAVRSWGERHRTWEASWARLDLAQCHLRSNRFADAAVLLAEVRSFADGVGSEPLSGRVDELARAARGRGLVEEPWRPLTAREFEVARLIAGGMTNGEIADELSIAPKTASAHVEHILAKLGVTRRAEVAAWAATIAAAGASGVGGPAAPATASMAGATAVGRDHIGQGPPASIRAH
ncbi:MAG TPA: helix-turn-helix transcriptional regulator, partial [Candidatus Limnocylindrales bacterium]|nr:helix-turn-helix transcriptional regulator [Candidatus Limnocylindrales bacterium]